MEIFKSVLKVDGESWEMKNIDAVKSNVKLFIIIGTR
jgi:hypothetical protein